MVTLLTPVMGGIALTCVGLLPREGCVSVCTSRLGGVLPHREAKQSTCVGITSLALSCGTEPRWIKGWVLLFLADGQHAASRCLSSQSETLPSCMFNLCFTEPVNICANEGLYPERVEFSGVLGDLQPQRLGGCHGYPGYHQVWVRLGKKWLRHICLL